MHATCLSCNWTSLNYIRPHALDNAVERHQRMYHAGRTNIISIHREDLAA